MKKHDLKEYKFARDVVKDFPIIQKELANCAEVLYSYKKYTAAAHVLYAIEDSLTMIKRQLKYYEDVYSNKGES